MNAADLAAIAEFPALQRLILLRDGGGWEFFPLHRDGELVLVVGARAWQDGWSDSFAVRDRGDAKGFRCDPDGGEVWRREGSLIDVVDALRELPAPGQPGAPRLVIGTSERLRIR
jgi:hypothetical protein